MPHLSAKSLGQYQIIEPIGSGGMAQIYRAYQPSVKRDVVIKVLSPTFQDDPGFVKRFAQEVDVVAHLQHPQIIPVQFMEHPCRVSNEATFVAAVMSDRVIAGIGWIPTRLDTGRDVRVAAFACDLFVDPEIQKSGAGRALVAEIPRHVALTVWAGASPTMIGDYTKLGFPRLAPARLMLLLLDPGALLGGRLQGAVGRLASIMAAPIGIALRWLARPRPLPDGIELDNAAPFDASWDRSSERRRRPGRAAPVKDAAYLRWRYVDTPLGPYGFVTARRGGEILGTLVFRIRPGTPALGVLDDLF